jgi:hypothetical protein
MKAAWLAAGVLLTVAATAVYQKMRFRGAWGVAVFFVIEAVAVWCIFEGLS